VRSVAEIAGVERKMHFFVDGPSHIARCSCRAYPLETAEAFCDGHTVSFASSAGSGRRSIL